jgi:hypothetical protein
MKPWRDILDLRSHRLRWWRRGGRVATQLLLVGIAIVLVGPLTYRQDAQHQLDVQTRTYSQFGGPLVGLNSSIVRSNIFTLALDVLHPVRIVDHGTLHQSYLLGVWNFMSGGTIETIADALNWYGILLTPRQGRVLQPCRTLDALAGATLIIQPDPWQYGVASWYGPGFDGRLAASGEIYNMYDLTAAHKTLPLGSWVRVVNQHNGASVVVRINDRGPYVSGRIIDLSFRAQGLIGMDGGLASVYIERLDPSATDGCAPTH